MISIPLDPVLVWLMVFTRIAFLFVFFPVMGEGFLMARLRVIISGVVAFALTPVVPVSADLFPQTVSAMVFFIGSEALLGFSLGFIGKLLFAVIQFSGQVGGEQMGFGIVNAINPTSGHQVSVVAEMQYLLAILVFLSSGLHHVFISVLANSFAVLPPGSAEFTPGVADFFMNMGSALFNLSVRFAMPVIVVIFAINMGMAMIGRAVPQINIFIESFPLRIMAGVLVIIASLGILVQLWLQMFGSMEPAMAELLSLMRG